MIALWIGMGWMMVAGDGPATPPRADSAFEASLARAPGRRAEWEFARHAVAPEHRAGMDYLLAYLPPHDLEKMAPKDLVRNVELAYQARSEVPWGAKLPENVFLDAVLPHANVTEARDSMRAEFHDKFLPLVRGCKTPGEAALRINSAAFKDYKVTYNTRRLRTDQNPRETIAQGMATCTGLSILLVDACRSVGVPARLAGIHSWPGRGGNHTWVEIWDDGWHAVGAAEPDPAGLDHAWFIGEASRALKGTPENAIYAVTYRPTGTHFPLAWDRDARINAEDVTDRYTKGSSPGPARPRLMVEVVQGGQRVEADVTAFDRRTGDRCLAGKSLGPQADVNLHLAAPVAAGERFVVSARFDGRAASSSVQVDGDTVVRIDLDRPDPEKSKAELATLLADRFGEDAAKKAVATKILAEVPPDAAGRALAWKAYKASPMHAALRQEFEARTVKTPSRTSPYLWRHVGEKPQGGWALVIAMHGGGGAPKEVNDSQWRGMFERYYKDHPEAGGYVYLALRAPNDEWNGFYDDAIGPLVTRLIRQFVVFGEVDPNRVEILGASHGGYGAFVIGPKLADRFAAVHASASAPTPGETRGENLRNTRFTFMVGEKDTAYGRADRCREYAQQVETWKAQLGGFPGGFEWKPGVGHSVPDRDKVAEMLRAGPRDAHPRRVIWAQSDDALKHSYWVEAPHPAEDGRIDASVKENIITLKAENQAEVAFWLDDALVDLSRPVTVEVVGGKVQVFTPRPNLGCYCLGLEERGDPDLAAPVRIVVSAKP